MKTMMDRTFSSMMAASLGTVALLGVGCGGGGDDPPPTPSGLEVVARDGDVFPGGFEVGTIESANMSDDRTVAMIASERETPSFNGVFVKRPGQAIETVLTAGDPIAAGLSFVTVRNLEMAPTGQFAFEVGNELDNDGVFYWDGATTSVLARTGGNSPVDGFRITGALRVTRDGLTFFTSGGSPCTVDSTNPDDPDIRCDLKIHTAAGGQVSEVVVPNALTNQTPTGVLIEVNDRGEAVLGMSARGSEPLIGLVRGGQFEGVLPRRAELAGLGTVTSARPRAISPNGSIALDAFFDEDGDGARDNERVLILQNGVITSIEERGGSFDGNPEVDLRAEGIDGNDRVIYRVDFDSAAAGSTLRSYRAWQNGQKTFIVHEGMPFGEDRDGNDQRVLDIEQVRVFENGDVLFVAQLGFEDQDEDTRTITGTVLLRWNGGGLETLLELGAQVEGQALVGEISIADENRFGDILVITSLGRPANRILLLLPR